MFPIIHLLILVRRRAPLPWAVVHDAAIDTVATSNGNGSETSVGGELGSSLDSLACKKGLMMSGALAYVEIRTSVDWPTAE